MLTVGIPYLNDTLQAILFIAAASSYNQTLAEDEDINRLQDAVDLYGKITENKLLQNTPVVLFLNKMDILEDKIKRDYISNYFPEFQSKIKF